MNELERTYYWHKLINSEQREEDLLKFFIEEQTEYVTEKCPINQVKEACDCIVTAAALVVHHDDIDTVAASRFKSFIRDYEHKLSYIHNVSATLALKSVNDSNFSKLFKADEIGIVENHYSDINIRISELDGSGLFGVYSLRDQFDSSGKRHPANKLLKPPMYKPVDTSKEFWHG